MALADRFRPRNCASCGDLLPVRMDGPLGTYCSTRCRKRAEQARKAAKAGALAWQVPGPHLQYVCSRRPTRRPSLCIRPFCDWAMTSQRP